MMKKTKFAAILLSVLSLTSCGLMDMDVEDISTVKMYLDRDTVYLMVGDEFTLVPQFKADSLNVFDDVFWSSSADSVLSVNENVFKAKSEGWALLSVLSVRYGLEDSCYVNVMQRWEDNSRQFPNEMILFADVDVHGKPFDPETMILGAFVDGKVRGIGQLMETNGRQYVRFRIGSDILSYDPNGVTEEVTFRVYFKKELRYEEFPQSLEFDGETHGTLSNLYKLSL